MEGALGEKRAEAMAAFRAWAREYAPGCEMMLVVRNGEDVVSTFARLEIKEGESRAALRGRKLELLERGVDTVMNPSQSEFEPEERGN